MKELNDNNLYIITEDHQGFTDRYLCDASQITLDYLEGNIIDFSKKSKKRILYNTMKYLMYVLEDSIGRGECNINVLHDIQFLAGVLKKPCLSNDKVTKISIRTMGGWS